MDDDVDMVLLEDPEVDLTDDRNRRTEKDILELGGEHGPTPAVAEGRPCRLADQVIVPDIYNAREERDEYGRKGSEELVSRIHQQGGRARYLGSLDEVTRHLEANVAEGDLVPTMGAGDVWRVADGLVERICAVV